MTPFCCANPLLYRLNLFSVYVLVLISCILILTQLNLVSRYGPRVKQERSFMQVVMDSTDLPRDMAILGLADEFRNFEAEYKDMIVTEDENATDFVYVDDVTIDLSNFVYKESETEPTREQKDVEQGVQRSSLEVKENTELLRRMHGLKRLHLHQGRNGKSILFWNALQFPEMPIPQVPVCGGGCRISRDRKDYNHSDAIVFTMKEFNTSDMPDPGWRRPDQVYVWWCEESPWTSKNMYGKKLDDIEDHYFNWTMTYKRNSDVNAMMVPYTARDYVMSRLQEHEKIHPPSDAEDRLPYEQLEPPAERTEKEIFTLKRQASKLVKRKKKLAVWVASNCGYTSGALLRMNVLTKITNHGLDIDVFGECGDNVVPESLTGFADVLSEYKFYFAFENTVHCRDYITEKFWYNALHAGSVPIIWGPQKTDLEAVAPPNSFIFYEDFETAAKLVEYISYLNSNDEEYIKYFAWWWEIPGYFPVYGVTETDGDVLLRTSRFDFEINAFCHLCSRLNNDDHKKHTKSIKSLSEWWYKNESEICLAKSHKIKWIKDVPKILRTDKEFIW